MNFSLTYRIMLRMKIPDSEFRVIVCSSLKNDNSEFFQVKQSFKLKTRGLDLSSFIQSVHKDFSKGVNDKTF